MSEPLTLKKPIQANGETVSALNFREPTGKDIAAAGVPFELVDEDGITVTRFNGRVMRKLIAALADIPPSSVDQLVASDWVRAMGQVALFFGESEMFPTPAAPSPSSRPN